MFEFLKYLISDRKRKKLYTPIRSKGYYKEQITHIENSYKFPRFNEELVKYFIPVVGPSTALLTVVSIAVPAINSISIHLALYLFSFLCVIWLAVAIHDIWQIARKKWCERQIEIQNGHEISFLKLIILGNKPPEVKILLEPNSKEAIEKKIYDIEHSYKFPKYGKYIVSYIIPTVSPIVALFTSLSLVYPAVGPFAVYGLTLLTAILVITLSSYVILDIFHLTQKKWLEYKLELREDIREIDNLSQAKNVPIMAGELQYETSITPTNYLTPDNYKNLDDSEIIAVPTVS